MLSKKIITTNLEEDSLSIIEKSYNPRSDTLYLKDLILEKNLVINKKGPIDLLIDKEKLLVINSEDDSLFEIDIQARRIISITKLGRCPTNIGIYEDKIYIINSDSNSLTIMDSRKMEVVETISLGNNPSSLAIDHIYKRIFISNFEGSSISIIEIKGKKIDYPIEDQPLKVKIYGDYIYILSILNSSNRHGSKLSLIDRRQLRPVDSIYLKGLFYDFVKIHKMDQIYLINPEDGYLYKLEEAEKKIKKALYLGGLARKILYDGKEHLYINDIVNNEILIVNIDKNIIEYRIKVGREPQGILLV